MTNCIESSLCMPSNPADVLNIFDVWFGAGMTILVMALIIGIITVGIYVRNRSLPMLAVLGTYESAAFAAILTSKYISAQYAELPYIIGLCGATAVVMMLLRLIKE